MPTKSNEKQPQVKSKSNTKQDHTGAGLVSYIKQKMKEREIKKQKMAQAEDLIRKEKIRLYQEKIKKLQR